MKKFTLIFVLGALTMFLAPKAQAQVSLFSRYSVALDTVTNTATKNMTSLRVYGNQNTVTISAKTTNLTGTQSGVLRLFGSIDGVVYHRITAALLHANSVAPIDSLVIDPAHLVKAWVVDKSPFQYYQVQATGIGTVTFTVFGNYVAH